MNTVFYVVAFWGFIFLCAGFLKLILMGWPRKYFKVRYKCPNCFDADYPTIKLLKGTSLDNLVTHCSKCGILIRLNKEKKEAGINV